MQSRTPSTALALPRAVLVAALLLCASPAFPQAATRPAATQRAPATQKLSGQVSVTDHEMTVAGQFIRYRATAGYLPVKDEAGKERANFFFVAYDRTDAPQPTTRPITFIFNGGPGAAAAWLHVGAAGPMRLAPRNDLGEVPAPPYKLVENESTWLDVTDLVFIDPIGTGYSRAAAGEKPEAFYGVKEDVAAVADFIRLYTTRHERWPSPKFLAGESYGTTRAAALSEYLLDRYGLALNGVVLMSSVLDFATIQPGPGNDLPYALFLPSYTAAAWYHKKLAPDLQQDLDKTLKEAEQFAMGDYLLALAKGDSLAPEQRKTIADKLARYSGLPISQIQKDNLRVGPAEFEKSLLDEERKVLGRYDARITGYALQPAAMWPSFDPSFSGFFAAYTATINDYLRRDLRFESDLNYEVLTDRVHPWNFGNQGHGYLNVTDDLRSAMAKLPRLKIMFASGTYDLATPYLSADYTIDHLDLNRELRGNIVRTFYQGGHMMYHNAQARQKLKQDLAALIRAGM